MAETSKRAEPGEDRGGEWVEMSGKEYKIPPLNFKALREVQGKVTQIGAIKGVPTPEQMDIVVDVVYMAMRRNYPDMKRETVEDILDVGNMMPVFAAVMRVAGFKALEEAAGKT